MHPQEYGLVVIGEEEENGEEAESEKEDDDMNDLSPRKIAVKKVLLSQEASELLSKGSAQGSLGESLLGYNQESVFWLFLCSCANLKVGEYNKYLCNK